MSYSTMIASRNLSNHNVIRRIFLPEKFWFIEKFCHQSFGLRNKKAITLLKIFFCILFWRLEGVIWKQRFIFYYWKLFEWWLYVFSSKRFKVWSVKAFEVRTIELSYCYFFRSLPKLTRDIWHIITYVISNNDLISSHSGTGDQNAFL